MKIEQEQFILPLDEPVKETPETPLTTEEILSWDEQKRNTAYKDAVGVNPRIGKSPEQVAYGILNTEKERASLEAEDREDDERDVRSTYRR